MGGEDLHALLTQDGYGVGDGFMLVDLDPVVAALGGMIVHAHALGPDRMDIMNADGVAGADHGGQIVGLVHLLQTDGQIGLAHGQHLADTRETFRIHGTL